jgi:hypothetical protein
MDIFVVKMVGGVSKWQYGNASIAISGLPHCGTIHRGLGSTRRLAGQIVTCRAGTHVRPGNSERFRRYNFPISLTVWPAKY